MSGTSSEQRAFEERMRLQIEAYHAAALAYAAVKLGLPDRMGERALTAKELATELGLSAPHLLRFLRGLTTLGICRELPDGTFALAPGGWSLRSDSHSRLNKKVQIVVEQYWRPWADLVSCLKTGEPAFDHVFGMSVTDWRRENAAQGLMFASYLTDETFAQGGSILEVLECAAEAKKIADIGGGCGALLTPLLIGFPHLTGVLFETPPMIETAKPFLQVFDQFHLLERIELVPGDFFEAIPVKADLYLLKNVLQQWDDDDALAILRNIRKAMPEGARLAIIERLMPERAADDPSAVMVDLHMMTITGGKTRSPNDFKSLLAAAGLKLAKTSPTTSGLAVIEAVHT
ncbi:MAG TPA: methyltransferase [Methyloceanibacter sp.]|nr:methyltransferase [Methyloceanibacter sp.]